ncbi:TOBE domain-containing protein [Bosea sp. TAF32]|uniref:TOBE domain-containing protein n=1 Tax=Bosea sp. TAF32 TaxID=3237482 RepID=UPI003F8EA9DF
MLLRLETIRLSKEEQSPEDIGFTVAEIVNYGDSFLVIGKSAGQELRARVPGLDMPVLARGERCGIGWSKERVHIVPR